ncbi:probable aspartyl aminopeptidase, partial [Tanacetum coccineum]
ALIDAAVSKKCLEDESGVRMVALFDHEEAGSTSAQGAGSPVIFDALNRITTFFSSNPQVCLPKFVRLLEKAIQKSLLVSADMARALHPNYMDVVSDDDDARIDEDAKIVDKATTLQDDDNMRIDDDDHDDARSVDYEE